MSLNNLLIVSSSQEARDLLEEFFNENSPQRPGSETVLDFSLQIPLPTENINDIEQWKAVNWGTGRNCWNSKIRTKSDKEIVYEFTTQYTIPSLWLINISLKYSKLEFSLTWFNKDDSGTLIVKNGVTTWGRGFHYSL